MIEVEVSFQRSIEVSAAPDDAFALVSDLGRVALLWPDLERISDVDGRGRWRWLMKERGFGPIKLKVEYDAVYTIDVAARSVHWAPPGRSGGDMDSFGSWRIEATEAGSRLHFEARTLARIPAPRLMASMVETIAQEELKQRKTAFTDNVRQALSGA